jgi:hypothetical protein
MPVFWKQMSCENRHAAVAIIGGHVMKAKTNEENSCPWRIENVLEVLKYVALDDMLQLRGCYHTSKIDPSVFVKPEPDKTVVIEIVSREMLNAFRWNSKIHMDAIRRETTRGNNGSLLGPCGGASRKTADAFFSYITNFVSQRHSVITRGRQFLEPRAYLNVEKTDEQS